MTPKICIVGLGAIGSHAALLLRGYALSLVDFDRVEAKNTFAQQHKRASIGQQKTRSLLVELNGFGVTPQLFPVKLAEENLNILDGCTVIVDCTDNIAARQLMKNFSLTKGVPCLHSSMSADGTFGRIMWSEVFTPDKEDPGAATCEDGENLPFHGIVGAHTASVVQRFLKTGKKENYLLQESSCFRLRT